MNLLNENHREKRDLGDAILHAFGCRRIDAFDEYNLKTIRENEGILEQGIRANSKYIVELKNYVIQEKQHNQKRMELLEQEMYRALNESNERMDETIIELSIMEIIYMIEHQVMDIRRQLNAIGHSIDRDLKISTTEIFDMIKDEEILQKIQKECGVNKRLSLNRATIFTRNEANFLNATITIPVYKITPIPKIIGGNTIQVPLINTNYVIMATNSHQYAEINDIKSLCKQENEMFFCKVN